MSEPIVEIDYEFHFTGGEVLFFTVMEGRDTVHDDGEDGPCCVLIVRPAPETTETITVYRHNLNGMRVTRREITQEPQLPGAEHGT